MKSVGVCYCPGLFVNMPYRLLDKYREYIFRFRINVEIGVRGDELDVVPVKEFEKLGKVLKSNDVMFTLHGPFWDLCPGSEDPLVRQVTRLRFHQLMDIAEVMRPVQVVLHTGFDPRHHRGLRDAWIERAVEVLESIVKRAEHAGFPIALENVWEESPHVHRTIIDAINSPFLGFCLDVGHQNCFSRTPLKEWLNALHGNLLEIHIHDNNGKHDTHSPPGTGTVDFNFLFNFLFEKSIYPVLNTEPHNEKDFIETHENIKQLIPTEFLNAYRKALAQTSIRT
ncbi:MAG: sugar phosphate isomerase/epimerase [Deltaproteobacteria bacterium]|nr:sugar phosphate isomerase/epimerase [Deltaproteobacteria bacterium]MBW2067438.1 sugar phosphate isomerase/epimerase [Deltaproteobacteria bacterium]